MTARSANEYSSAASKPLSVRRGSMILSTLMSSGERVSEVLECSRSGCRRSRNGSLVRGRCTGHGSSRRCCGRPRSRAWRSWRSRNDGSLPVLMSDTERHTDDGTVHRKPLRSVRPQPSWQGRFPPLLTVGRRKCAQDQVSMPFQSCLSRPHPSVGISRRSDLC